MRQKRKCKPADKQNYLSGAFSLESESNKKITKKSKNYLDSIGFEITNYFCITFINEETVSMKKLVFFGDISEVDNWFLLFTINTVSFRHLDIALMYWRIFLEMKLEDMLDFIEKNTFFNSGLCPPFSEKRYICFLVNILVALLIIFIPNLVRKCQIMCCRIRVEEIMFLCSRKIGFCWFP